MFARTKQDAFLNHCMICVMMQFVPPQEHLKDYNCPIVTLIVLSLLHQFGDNVLSPTLKVVLQEAL